MISIAPSRSRVWEKLPEFTQFSYFNSAIRFLHGKPFTLKIYDFGLGNGEWGNSKQASKYHTLQIATIIIDF